MTFKMTTAEAARTLILNGDTGGRLSNLQPDFVRGGDVDLISLTVECISQGSSA